MSTPKSPLTAPVIPPAGAVRAFQVGTPIAFSDRSRAAMWERIEPTDTCWLWRGYIDPDGYGQYLGRPAHRVVYERLICALSKDLQLDHRCRNLICVNPAHLEPVTQLENMLRALPHRRPKTHCVHGHKYTADDFDSKGHRACRKCKRIRSQQEREGEARTRELREKSAQDALPG